MRLLVITLLLLFSSAIFSEPVNINEADAKELADSLSGVGPKKAQAIIKYRENNGPFFTPEELINVKGIGPKTLEKNLENIIVRN